MGAAGFRPTMHFGERFKVRSQRGNLYVLTFLRWVDGAGGVYVRMGNRDIARLDDRRVEWSSWDPASDPGEPVLRGGDEVMVEGNGGAFSGRLLEMSGSTLRLRSAGGAESTVNTADVERFYLMFRAPSLKPGDRFLAASRSGQELRGDVQEGVGGETLLELGGGKSVPLSGADVDPNSVQVLIPIPLEDLTSDPDKATVASDIDEDEETCDEEWREILENPDARDVFLRCNPLTPVQLTEDAPLIVGRSPRHADLVLPNKAVSRRHAEFVRRADGVYVRDLGSLNGTWVGSVRVDHEFVRIPPGALVRIEVFHLSLEDGREGS